MKQETLFVRNLEVRSQTYLEGVVLGLDLHGLERAVVIQISLFGAYYQGESFVHQDDDGESGTFALVLLHFLLGILRSCLVFLVGMEEVRNEVPRACERVFLISIYDTLFDGLEVIASTGDGSDGLTVYADVSGCAFCDGDTFNIFELTQFILRDDAGYLTCLNIPIHTSLLALLQIVCYCGLFCLRFCRLFRLRCRLRFCGLNTCAAVGTKLSTFFEFMMTMQ